MRVAGWGWITVGLPEPDEPSSATRSPGCTRSCSDFNTWTSGREGYSKLHPSKSSSPRGPLCALGVLVEMGHGVSSGSTSAAARVAGPPRLASAATSASPRSSNEKTWPGLGLGLGSGSGLGLGVRIGVGVRIRVRARVKIGVRIRVSGQDQWSGPGLGFRLPVGAARRYLGGRSQGLLHACPLVGDIGRCARDELRVQYEGREVRAGEDARRREGATQGEHARDQDRVERAWAGLGLGLGLGLRVGVGVEGGGWGPSEQCTSRVRAFSDALYSSIHNCSACASCRSGMYLVGHRGRA